VDDADGSEPQAGAFFDVVFDQAGDFFRPEGVQVDDVLDRDFDRLHGLLLSGADPGGARLKAVMTTETLALCGIPLLAYLLGSIPFGLVLTRLFTADDIRRQGSGNIGATNVARVAGAGFGLATLAGDFFKGFVPVYLALRLAPAATGPEALGTAAALLALAGHLFPVYNRFRGGGKGVATAAGGFTALAPFATLAAAGVFLLVFLAGRRVSLASLAAVALLPVAVFASTGSVAVAAGAALAAIFIFLRHHENIRRLRNGTEPAFALRKKPGNSTHP
jgi:glycerol-3-phosphate acyltransferase PlsY